MWTFKDFICKNDIVILNETKTDNSDLELVKCEFDQMDYDILLKNRKKMSAYRSGGIGICFKKEIRDK